MNVDTLGAIAEASGETSGFGGAPAGDEFEGVLRQTLGTEEVASERSEEASAEGAEREDSSGEDLEAAEEQEEENAESLSDTVTAETRDVEVARVFTGELGHVATVDRQALVAAEGGAANANVRESVAESEEIPDEAQRRNPGALNGVVDAESGRGQQETADEDSARGRGRTDERTESNQVAQEHVARDQVVQDTRGETNPTAPADQTEIVSARAEVANEARSEPSPANPEQNTLNLEGANTGDRQEREPSEDGRTASPADPSRENLSAEARTESEQARSENADRAASSGYSAGADAVSTNPVSTPLVAAPLTVESTAAPGSPIPPPAADAVAVQTEWLVSRGGGAARLVLHPPELGEIAIRVTVRDGAVDVVMVAQEGAAKTIAEQQGDRLMQAFANRDLRMESFEVRRGDAASLGNQGDPSFREPGGGQGQADAGDDRREGATADRGNGFDRSNPVPGEAVAPQILSVATASGIDLRI